MKQNQNFMILNGISLEIGKVELNEFDLLVTDKSNKYCFRVCVKYSWKEINCIKVGMMKEIDFNEYSFSENNESVLILPSCAGLEKLSNDVVCFYFSFENLSREAHYMNKRGCFDIKLESLDVKVFVNYKDVLENAIIYNF